MGQENFWKWISAILASLLIGVLTGQFIPNRNIATNDQLDAKMAPLTAAIATETLEIASMRDQLNDLKGQLKAQHLLSIP